MFSNSSQRADQFVRDVTKLPAEELVQIKLRRNLALAGVVELTSESGDAGGELKNEGMAGKGEQGSEASDANALDKEEQFDRHLLGLAFSGGGIRSATFGLGVLQGLSELGLLKYVDYLSTVSGGGYIGGWLAAWIKRDGDVRNVEIQLRPSRIEQAKAQRDGLIDKVCNEDPEPIAHLRQFSQYLAPRGGFFSLDTWTLVGLYLIGFLMIQLVLLPSLLCVMLGVRWLAAEFIDRAHSWHSVLPDWLQWMQGLTVFTFGVPAILLGLMFLMICGMAIFGRLINPKWWERCGRINAWCLIVAASYLAVVGFTLYSSIFIERFGFYTKLVVTSAWIGTVAGGVKWAVSSATSGEGNMNWKEWFVAITPFVFLIGLLMAVSCLAEWLAGGTSIAKPDRDWLISGFLVALTIALAFGSCVDINKCSLSGMYRNRLVRCYLGASRRKDRESRLGVACRGEGPLQEPDPFTHFDFNDDLDLKEFCIGSAGASTDDKRATNKGTNRSEPVYSGPYLLINTAMNLAAGKRLDWQERQAEAFLLSPSFAGRNRLSTVPRASTPTGRSRLGEAWRFQGRPRIRTWGITRRRPWRP